MRVKGTNLISRFSKNGRAPTAIIKKSNMKYVLWAVVLFAFTIGYSYAGTWVEQFDDEKLNGWQRITSVEEWRVRWRVVERILFSQIRRSDLRAVCDEKDGDFMLWNAHQFRLDSLTVIGSEIFYPPPGRGGWGELGLFLGKQQPFLDFVAKGYFFSPEKTSEATFSVKEGYGKGKVISEYENKFKFTTKSLKVAFNSGKFRILTGSVLLTEFVDNKFPEIDVVGVLITCHGEWFSGSISSLSVSGGGIPNHNYNPGFAVQLQDTQLSTTWARLKQYE